MEKNKISKTFSLFYYLHTSSISILVQPLVEYDNFSTKHRIQRCGAYQRRGAYQREVLFQCGYTKVRRLFETRCLLEKHGIRNLFRLEKEVKEIKDIVLKNIKNFFKHKEEEEHYYNLVKVNKFQGNNCIEYKSNVDKSRILPAEEYLHRTREYLKDAINDLKKSDTWKI